MTRKLRISYVKTLINLDCVPYSEGACKYAAFDSGYAFQALNSEHVKGCYSYEEGSKYHGNFYYARLGTEDQVKTTFPENDDRFRPPRFDCEGNKF